jgi:HlyD family secretion protein
VSGGTTLMTMADLSEIQVRTLVDETDIGKVKAGQPADVTVEAYPGRHFDGTVYKIEPQAIQDQNVTMFPVLVRIPNPGHLLRPGMNTEVEVHIGERHGVLAIPNAALRTSRDLASAAQVLGLDPAAVQAELAARDTAGPTARIAAGTAAADTSPANVLTLPDGRRMPLPEGVTADQVRAIFAKMRSGGGPAALSSDERAILTRLRSAFGDGGRGGRGGRGAGSESATSYEFGGTYIVFALRGGAPVPLRIRTGLTDLDYSEVVSGLSEGDTVLVLPSASLVASQQEFQQRIGSRAGLPGVQRQNSSSNSRGR